MGCTQSDKWCHFLEIYKSFCFLCSSRHVFHITQGCSSVFHYKKQRFENGHYSVRTSPPCERPLDGIIKNRLYSELLFYCFTTSNLVHPLLKLLRRRVGGCAGCFFFNSSSHLGFILKKNVSGSAGFSPLQQSTGFTQLKKLMEMRLLCCSTMDVWMCVPQQPFSSRTVVTLP